MSSCGHSENQKSSAAVITAALTHFTAQTAARKAEVLRFVHTCADFVVSISVLLS